MQQQQHHQPVTVAYVVQQPVQLQVTSVSTQPAGQFVGGFLAVGSKVCGGLIMAMGIMCVGAGMAETIYVVTELEIYRDGDVFTANEYAGYWCGMLIIAAGALAAETGRRPTDALIISSLVSAVAVGVTFSCTLLGLTAYVFDTDVTKIDVLYGSYVTMVIGAAFALILSLVISALCLKAIICRKPAAKSAGEIQMTTQTYQYQHKHHHQQQQQSFSEYHTGQPPQQLQAPSAYQADFVSGPSKY